MVSKSRAITYESSPSIEIMVEDDYIDDSPALKGKVMEKLKEKDMESQPIEAVGSTSNSKVDLYQWLLSINHRKDRPFSLGLINLPSLQYVDKGDINCRRIG